MNEVKKKGLVGQKVRYPGMTVAPLLALGQMWEEEKTDETLSIYPPRFYSHIRVSRNADCVICDRRNADFFFLYPNPTEISSGCLVDKRFCLVDKSLFNSAHELSNFSLSIFNKNENDDSLCCFINWYSDNCFAS